MSISYSDGAEIESFILSLVRSASRIDSSENIGRQHYGQWAVKYHLDSQRANLVRHLDWSGLKVLEVGAGMGAVSRFLAEHCGHLTVVEGTQARFDVLASRLRDLTNWDGKVGNFESVTTESDYDVVCLIGVLEYAELYVKPGDGETPFGAMLKRARSCLKPGGTVLIAIENRLGLKYFAGCSEDHTNRVFDGICGYRLGPSPRTFSREELRTLLVKAGLENLVEQYPYPDYKIPACVLGEDMVDRYPATAAELASAQSYQDYAHPGTTLYPCSLLLESINTQPTLMKELSNSFLFLASAPQPSEAAHKLLGKANGRQELAWHYTRARKQPVRTVFHGADDLVIEKEMLSGEPIAEFRYADDSMEIEWQNPGTENEVQGTKLTRLLLRHAYFGDFATLEELLVDFLGWVFKRFSLDGETKHIQGLALDAHAGNAFITSDVEPYVLIDREWVLAGPMRKSWFVIRNLNTFDQDLNTLLRDHWGSLRKFYERICSRMGVDASFDQDIANESRFFCLLHDGETQESIRSALSNVFSATSLDTGVPSTGQQAESGNAYPLRATRELVQERDRLRAEVAELRAHHQRKIYWAPRMIDELIVRARGLKGR